MFKLNSTSIKAIEKGTGLNIEDIKTLSPLMLEKKISKKIGKKIKGFIDDPRLIGRGSVYLFLKRFLCLSKVDKRVSKI